MHNTLADVMFGFEFYKFDFPIMKIISVLHELECVCSHVLMYYAGTAKLSKSIYLCACKYMLLDQ